MQIWAEVYGADEATSYGRVNLASCVVTRSLDMAGLITLEVPTGDAVAVQALRLGRWVKIYANPDEHKRLIGEGILQARRVGVGGQDSVAWEAADRLELLRRKNTWRGLIYDDWPIADVIDDLCNMAGWGSSIDDSITGVTSWRFDGMSILEAVANVCAAHGLHFRLGQGNVLEVGPFGESRGVVFSHLQRIDPSASPEIGLIEALTISHEGYEVINVIEPIAGPVDYAMTLRRATRNSPLPVEVVQRGKQKAYILRDENSIAQYGEIEAVVGPDQILVPLNTTKQGYHNMANVLYEWAVNYLQRAAYPQTVYSLSAVNVPSRLLPGDSVRVRYVGEAWVEGVQARYVDVNEELWALGVTTRWNLQGAGISLEVSNIDKQPKSGVELVAATIEQTKIKGNGPTGSWDRRAKIQLADSTSPSSGAELPFTIQNTTVDIITAPLTVRTVLLSGSRESFAYQIRIYIDDVGVGQYTIVNNVCDTVVVDLADALVSNLDPLQGDHSIFVYCDLIGTAQMEFELVEVIIPGAAAAVGGNRVCS